MKGWVLITGAAKRIGRAIALDLATHGWDIVVHYHRSANEAKSLAEEIQALGRAACLAEIDLSNPEHTDKMVFSLAEEIGMIDALINNASLFEPDTHDPDGSHHWAVNADAPRILSKAFRDHLPRNEKAAIVNILDGTPCPAAFSAYGKSKNFLSDMTRNMAKSMAPQVRVNGVAPMYVLPSPRQSEEAFSKLAGDQRVTPAQVAGAVRKCLTTSTMSGEILQIKAIPLL